MAARLLKYEDFILETVTKKDLIIEHRNLYRNIFSQVEEIKPVLNEAMFLVEAGVFDDLLIENLLNILDRWLVRKYLLNLHLYLAPHQMLCCHI